tara:strand:- start:131 stop:718 length:588 start_codon:yes stop_codon:yes gene_type:complete
MAIVDIATLKGYFNAGDEPTEANFVDVFDSLLNLTDGGAIVGDTTAVTGTFAHRSKISLLTDAGAAGAIRAALTLADSGTHFIVPALTSGTQTLALPAVSAANVGFTCKFTMLGTAAQIFSVDTAASADKIISAEPDGDGDVTINASADKFRFTASAVVGASFRITMISATAATAFHISDIVSGLAAATGEHVAA